MAGQPDFEPFQQGSIRGFLHQPAAPSGDALVITHGAGGNCQMPLLIVVAQAFSQAGIRVLRCDLAFRQKRAHGAPSPHTAAQDRAGLREAVQAMRGMANGAVFLGGQSYGGRQASMLAAEEPDLASALLLLSYPLHPPGKPEQLRTAHFPSLRIPALFVHGSRDPFGSIEELRAALPLIPARPSLVEIARAGRDLARGKFDVQALVVKKFHELVRGHR